MLRQVINVGLATYALDPGNAKLAWLHGIHPRIGSGDPVRCFLGLNHGGLMLRIISQRLWDP